MLTATRRISNQPLPVVINILCFLIDVVLCISCTERDLDQQLSVRVTNNTKQTIDYLSLSTQEAQGKTEPTRIQMGASVDLKLDFKGVDKTDGGYKMKYKLSQSKDTLVSKFGYYTNGYPLEKAILIGIYADSVSTQFTY